MLLLLLSWYIIQDVEEEGGGGVFEYVRYSLRGIGPVMIGLLQLEFSTKEVYISFFFRFSFQLQGCSS